MLVFVFFFNATSLSPHVLAHSHSVQSRSSRSRVATYAYRLRLTICPTLLRCDLTQLEVPDTAHSRSSVPSLSLSAFASAPSFRDLVSAACLTRSHPFESSLVTERAA
ncbi:hypothetical protein EDB85DRAFT_1552023 [Lactarius pseudohatsudake]|nr:hypothetical protein EDB85DRAFT_1552023 [Lactarius pseudohatsudake]